MSLLQTTSRRTVAFGLVVLLGCSVLLLAFRQPHVDSVSAPQSLRLAPPVNPLLPPEVDLFTFGGSNNEQPRALAGTPNGRRLYVGGVTQSDDLPQARNAYQAPVDGFVCALDAAAETYSVAWCFYLGGTGPVDLVSDLAVTPDGDVIAIGSTFSADFPTTPGTLQPGFGGISDAFVTRLGADGTMTWSTFYGGSGIDTGNGIATDGAGTFWSVGTTGSADAPVQDPLQGFGGGLEDAFLVQGDLADGSLRFASPWGGTSSDNFQDVAVQDDMVFAVGSTNSPERLGEQPDLVMDATSEDVVLLQLTGTTPAILRFGGTEADRALVVHQLSIGSNFGLCVAGRTSSEDFPTSEGAFQPTYGGGEQDAFFGCGGGTDQAMDLSYWGGSGSDYIFDAPSAADFSLRGVFLATGYTTRYDVQTVNEVTPPTDQPQVFGWWSLPNPATIDDVRLASPLPNLVGQTPSVESCGPECMVVAGEVKENDIANVGVTRIQLEDDATPLLEVNKTVDEDTVAVGEMVTYTIEVVNPGLLEALDLMLTDITDATQLQFESASEGCLLETTTTTNIVNCDLGNLGPGDTVRVEITFTVQEAGEIENLVGVLGSNTGDEVSDVVTIVAGTPALEIYKTADTDLPQVGDVITYTISVENMGDGPARGVEVNDSFDDELFFVGGPPECSEEIGSSEFGPFPFVRCDVGELPPGAVYMAELKFVFLESVGDDLRNTIRQNMDFFELELSTIAPEPEVEFQHIFFGILRSNKHAHRQNGLDVYVDSLLTAQNLEPGTALPLTRSALGAISPVVHLVPTGGTLDDAVLTEQRDFFVGELTGDDYALPTSYALFLAGPPDAPTLLLQRNARFEAQDPSLVDLFFAHAAPDAPPLTLRLSPASTSLANNLAFGTLTDYTSLAPAMYVLEVTDDGGTSRGLFELDLSSQQGEGLAVAVVPVEDGQPGDIGVVIVRSDGTLLIPPVATHAETTPVPSRFALHTPHPNPFNQTTQFSYDLPHPSLVHLIVFDALGRAVRTLVDGEQAPGVHRQAWDGRDDTGHAVSAGVYFIRFDARASRSGAAYEQTTTVVHVK